MRLLYKVVAIVYKTFDDRGTDIPYFRSLVLILFLFFINLVSLGLLFDIPSHYLMPWRTDQEKSIQWIKAAIYFLTPLILFVFIFSKKKLDGIEVSDEQIYKGRRILPVYIVVSLILLLVLFVRHGMNKAATGA
jgi:hypothetical protein